MPDIMTKEAEAIAAKLARDTPQKPNRQKFQVTTKSGRDHDLVFVRYGKVFIGRYGIQRGSKQQRHNYVAQQLHLSRTQGYNLAKCPFSVDDFIDELIRLNEVDDPNKDKNEPTNR
jgi:hypothetical protein